VSADIIVRVEGVSKKFCRDLKRSLWYGLKDTAADLLGGHSSNGLRPDEFWALDGVSLELARGECLGLIGRNGAGKTTLLKMLNGLIKPDKGRIELAGRVGALISLGAGFNPILTGRENIYVNGSVLGLTTKEIDSKLAEIIAFSEIDDFIDTPVQSYSTGMQVRLGFAVATAMQPDVLLLDEVLAVGDAAFRNKCYERLAESATERPSFWSAMTRIKSHASVQRRSSWIMGASAIWARLKRGFASTTTSHGHAITRRPSSRAQRGRSPRLPRVMTRLPTAGNLRFPSR